MTPESPLPTAPDSHDAASLRTAPDRDHHRHGRGETKRAGTGDHQHRDSAQHRDLDAGTGQEIMGLLRNLNEQEGLTIVMVTHDPRAAERAHLVRHLDKGELSQD